MLQDGCREFWNAGAFGRRSAKGHSRRPQPWCMSGGASKTDVAPCVAMGQKGISSGRPNTRAPVQGRAPGHCIGYGPVVRLLIGEG